MTLPVVLVLGWLSMTLVSVAAYYRAELVRCEYAPAPSEPGHAYCDFVQQGGSEMLLFLPHGVVLLGLLVALATRSRTPAAIGLLIGLTIAGGSYFVASRS